MRRGDGAIAQTMNKYLTEYGKKQGKTQAKRNEKISERYRDRLLNYPEENDFYITLEREVDQIFKISPAQDEVPFYFDEVYSPFWNLFVLERPGPTITIFKID